MLSHKYCYSCRSWCQWILRWANYTFIFKSPSMPQSYNMRTAYWHCCCCFGSIINLLINFLQFSQRTKSPIMLCTSLPGRMLKTSPLQIVFMNWWCSLASCIVVKRRSWFVLGKFVSGMDKDCEQHHYVCFKAMLQWNASSVLSGSVYSKHFPGALSLDHL